MVLLSIMLYKVVLAFELTVDETFKCLYGLEDSYDFYIYIKRT